MNKGRTALIETGFTCLVLKKQGLPLWGVALIIANKTTNLFITRQVEIQFFQNLLNRVSKSRCQINNPTITVNLIFFLLLLMCFSTLKTNLSFLEKTYITSKIWGLQKKQLHI